MGFFSSAWKAVKKAVKQVTRPVSSILGVRSSGVPDTVEVNQQVAPQLQDFLGNPGSEEVEKESAAPKKKKRGKKELYVGVNSADSSGKTGLNI